MKTLNQLAQKYNVDIEKAQKLLLGKGKEISDINAPLDFETEMLAEEILGIQQRMVEIEKGNKPGKQIETREYPDYSLKSDSLKGCGCFAAAVVGVIFLICIIFFASMLKKTKEGEIQPQSSVSSSESAESQDGLSAIDSSSNDLSEIEDDGVKRAVFSWYDKNLQKQWEYSLEISDDIYQKYSSMQDAVTADVDYETFISDPDSEEYISDIVSEFTGISDESGYTRSQTVAMITTFVQSISYESGRENADIPKYPIETLYEGRGNEYDKSVLLVSILRNYGCNAVLLKFDDHIAVGIPDEEGIYEGLCFELDSVRYFYVETVAGNWDIGAAPEEYKDSVPEILLADTSSSSTN